MASIERRTDNGNGADAAAGSTPSSSRLRRDVPSWLRHHVVLLVAIDVVAAASATVISQFLAFGLQHAELTVRGTQIPYSAAVVAVVPAWLLVLAMAGSYDVGPFGLPAGETRRVISAGTHFLALMAVAYYVAHLEQLGRDFMIAIVPLATGLTLAGRLAARAQLHLQRANGGALRRAILLGPPDNSSRLLDHLARHPAAGVVPVAALVDGQQGSLRANGADVRILGEPADALAVLSSTDADVVLVTGNLPAGDLRSLTWSLEGTGIDVLVAPTVTEVASLVDVRPVAGLPLLHVDTRRVSEPRLPSFDGSGRDA